MSKKLKVGVIGLGQRGTVLIDNILDNLPHVEIVAICDKREEKIQKMLANIEKKGRAVPAYSTDYNDVLKAEVDSIIVSTSWAVHVEVALAAMEAGIPVAMEVGGTYHIDDCWKLVDCYERTNTPFFFLENCCYNKDEALATSLVRNGVFGDISYCSGCYVHDLRGEIAGGIDTLHYRLEEYKNHNCENYPTHELGPIAKILHINSGNRFVKLVSMSSKAQGLHEYIINKPTYKDRLGNVEFKQGDVVTTMIECENGETILLKLDTTLPGLYDRGLTVCGTKGRYCQTGQSVILDDEKYELEFTKCQKAFFNQDEYKEYLPDDWRDITEEQIKAGHGGMDYVMLKHFFEYVAEKRPMPIDVYDAVAWMSITALSEQSIAKGSMPVECPDFTRGKYKTRKTVDVLDLPTIQRK